jgi:hypothetical protein
MVFRETFETAGTLLGEVSMPELQDKPALDAEEDAEEIRSPGAIDDNDEDNEDEEDDDDLEDGEDEDEDDEEGIKEPEDGV